MTQPQIRIDTVAVRRHAQSVDDVARMCDEAASAAGYLDLHDEVYGHFAGPFIAPLLNMAQDAVGRELRQGADATAHLADLLRAVADNNDATDGTAAQRFRAGNQ